jgi:hypothetical protein
VSAEKRREREALIPEARTASSASSSIRMTNNRLAPQLPHLKARRVHVQHAVENVERKISKQHRGPPE